MKSTQVRYLSHRLRKDLIRIGLPAWEVDIVFHYRFSEKFYGQYYSPLITEGRPIIKIYPYENRNRDMMSYDELLMIAIHEMVHHVQYMSKNFVRYKNIAHNPEFWELYDSYIERAKELRLLKES